MSNYVFRKNSQIGNLDAEYDTFLKSCFLETNIFSNLLSFENSLDFTKRVIVGRTGSGKTALLKQLSENSKIKKHSIIEAESTVFEHIKNNVFISDLINKGIDLRIFYKSLWIHVLLVRVIELLYPGKTFLDYMPEFSLGAKKKYNSALAIEYVEKFRDNFFNDNIVTEITEKMQTDLSGSLGVSILKVAGKEITETTEKIQRATTQYISSELIRKQKELIKLLIEENSKEAQLKYIISIDDLDKSWLSSSSIRYDFINALLDAFRELIDIRAVKVIISIRTDILKGIYDKNLRQEEKDKSLIVAIDWDEKEIREMLDKRIDFLIKDQYQGRAVAKFADIFNFTVRGITAEAYIMERTMLRPRDAIDFVNLSLAEADGSTELCEDFLLEAEEKFYVSRKQALCKEWASIYKHIGRYVDSVSHVDKQFFKVEEIVAQIDKIQCEILSTTELDTTATSEAITADFNILLNIWFVVGIVGIKKTETLTIYSSFAKQELDISDFKKEFKIHPLFFRD
ncbi:P-loop ATPase, Sll1717 family [Pseudomonas yamanorum]|uniref:P-loop ATPase, Sll1717 family n=1 Tax=Pseudomonas yamanorum TaxID=515393 RepID=UPI00384DC06C